MPELPEVENFRKYFAETSLHQPIRRLEMKVRGMLIETKEADLKNTLEGNHFTDTFRHGKFLFVKLKSGEALMLHFGMTGDLLYYKDPPGGQDPPYVLLIHFANGHHLAFSDVRRLGKVALVKDVDQFISRRGYGTDALLISKEEFLEIFSKKRTAIKVSLMDQKKLAGVGNEYSDEILFQTKVHPASVTSSLAVKKLTEVFEAMRKILKEAVRKNSERSKLKKFFFLGNRKAGLKCPRCKGFTEWQTIGGRSAYFCPSCQKLYR